MKRLFVAGVSVMCLVGQALAANSFEALQKKLGIPLSEGMVVDASGRRPEVILIQDIHRHPEAQRHIRAMVLDAMSRLGAKEIFLEGAWTRGQNTDYEFAGLEDPDTYRENVAAYEAVEEDREGALQEVATAQMLGNTLDAADAPSWPLIKRLVQLRMKPAEYAEYRKHPFHPDTHSALARAVESAERFYQLALKRNDIFLANIKRRHPSGPQVLVVGGFHTAGMAETLLREGISYVVLAPRITQGGFEELYSQGMHQTISALKLGSGLK